MNEVVEQGAKQTSGHAEATGVAFLPGRNNPVSPGFSRRAIEIHRTGDPSPGDGRFIDSTSTGGGGSRTTVREKTAAKIVSKAEYRCVNIARWSVSRRDTYESAHTYYQPTPAPFASACEPSINILLNGLDLPFNNGRIPVPTACSLIVAPLYTWDRPVPQNPPEIDRAPLTDDASVHHLTRGQEMESSDGQSTISTSIAYSTFTFMLVMNKSSTIESDSSKTDVGFSGGNQTKPNLIRAGTQDGDSLDDKLQLPTFSSRPKDVLLESLTTANKGGDASCMNFTKRISKTSNNLETGPDRSTDGRDESTTSTTVDRNEADEAAADTAKVAK
ncbi:hypothetical protein K0M31_012985 [Melipona bicolor]|uniref:Uncharacterized protein n=1 Tax=Melipona bicolor TaxID=60889 RepID=A0AA40FJT9_9HYME|nr:hypothetical protein K0M31_012985 [Melipona bicolor]